MVEISSSVDTSPSPIRETHSAVRLENLRTILGSALLMSVFFMDGHQEHKTEQGEAPLISQLQVDQHVRLFADREGYVRRSPGEIIFCIGGKELSLTKWHIDNTSYGFQTEINGTTVDAQIDSVEITSDGNLVIHFTEEKGSITIGSEDVKRIAALAEIESHESTIGDIAYQIDLGTGYNEIYSGAQVTQSSLARLVPNCLANTCLQTTPFPPLKGTCSISIELHTVSRQQIARMKP